VFLYRVMKKTARKLFYFLFTHQKLMNKMIVRTLSNKIYGSVFVNFIIW